jgi:hypothetical protein
MSQETDLIEEGFKRLFKQVSTSFIAKVVEDKIDTVDVEDLSGTKYLDVRKIATQGKQGILCALPKDSFILVSRLSQSDELFVSMMSEIEGISIKIGETTVVVKNNKEITLNGGENGGLAIVSLIQDNFDSIKQYLDTLKTAIATGISAVGVGAAASGTIGAQAFNTAMTSAVVTLKDFENTNIKH